MFQRLKLTYLFLALLFLTGLIVTPSYGTPWDELSEKEIMRANIKEYVLRIFPEDSKIYRNYSELDVIRISESVERDHGAAALYPTELFLSSNLKSETKILLWHTYIYLIYFCGVIAVYYICGYLFSNPNWGILGAFIYFFTPRIFAEAHYNNKDIVLLSLLLCTFALFLSLVKRFSYSKLIGTAFSSALLINARIVGLALFGLFAIFYLCCMMQQLSTKKLIQRVAIGLSATALIYFLLTPALWGGNALDFAKYLLLNMIKFERWDNAILFRGTLHYFNTNPVPRYYLPWMITITTPPMVIAGYLLGNALLITDLIKKKKNFFRDPKRLGLVTMDLSCLIPVTLAIITQSRTYNGWRHFYFVYGAVVIITVYALFTLFTFLQGIGKTIFKGVIAVSLLVTCLSMVINHPYQFTYYNFLGGDAGTLYELNYWNVALKNALDKLLEHTGTEKVTIGACDGWTRDGLAKNLLLLNISRFENYIYEENFSDAQYVIINDTYAIIASESPSRKEELQYIRDNYELIVSIQAYGNELFAIYRKSQNLNL